MPTAALRCQPFVRSSGLLFHMWRRPKSIRRGEGDHKLTPELAANGEKEQGKKARGENDFERCKQSAPWITRVVWQVPLKTCDAQSDHKSVTSEFKTLLTVPISQRWGRIGS